MYSPITTNSSKKFGNNRWKSFSLKLNREVFLTSDLEYHHWLHVEFDPNIISYCEQPFEIKVPYGTTIASSIPDMWKLYNNGNEEIVEVKYYSDLNNTRVIKQIEVQRKWCKQHNITHTIATEKNLNKSTTLLSNYKLILKMLKQFKTYDENAAKKVTKLVQENVRLNISEISVILNSEPLLMLQIIAYLIYQGILHTDLSTQHFGLNTEVMLRER